MKNTAPWHIATITITLILSSVSYTYATGIRERLTPLSDYGLTGKAISVASVGDGNVVPGESGGGMMPSETGEDAPIGGDGALIDDNVTGGIDLAIWKLTLPTGDGDALEVDAEELSGYSDDNFMPQPDGSIIFTTQTAEEASTENSSYVRSELREQVCGGGEDQAPENQWVLSTASEEDKAAAGGIDGNMKATLTVNQVTESGDDDIKIGRIIIGQIHAVDDEMVRLYFHKPPTSDTAAIYFAHEPQGGEKGSETWHEFIGTISGIREEDGVAILDPDVGPDGIMLGETFSYEIDVTVDPEGGGSIMTVTLIKPDGTALSEVIDLVDSNYDEPGTMLYFKAGLYEGNYANANDYSSVTFHTLDVTHEPGGAGCDVATPTGDGDGATEDAPVATDGPEDDDMTEEFVVSEVPPSTLISEEPYLPDSPIALNEWQVTMPWDKDGDGEADNLWGEELITMASPDNCYQQGADSVTFSSQTSEAATTLNSTYMRCEMRQLFCEVDKSIIDGTVLMENVPMHNWVLGTASNEDQAAAAGINGTMTATLSVDSVTEEGTEENKIGRIIIGQIHAIHDEPVRLYFHKSPDSETAAVYFAHEPQNGGEEVWIPLIGEEAESGQGGADGIMLGERFSYVIDAHGSVEDETSKLTVTVIKEDGSEFSDSVDLEAGGYIDPGTLMYFKAGVYEGNKTSPDTSTDYSEVTFYNLDVVHQRGGAECGSAAVADEEISLSLFRQSSD